jgi:hypothetical protein
MPDHNTETKPLFKAGLSGQPIAALPARAEHFVWSHFAAHANKESHCGTLLRNM